MKLLVCASYALATFALSVVPSNAWTIISTPSTEANGALGPLTTTWTIVGTQPLEELVVQSMGRVFVDYDAALTTPGDAIVAKVVVSGDNRELLDTIEVVDADSGVKIHFHNDAFEGHGRLLTQVVVGAKQVLRKVTMAWSSDLIVGTDVLVEHDATKTVGLELVGSGNLFAGSPDTVLSLKALDVTLAGSGDVQLQTKSLDIANILSLNLTGSGDIAIVSDRVTVNEELSSLVAGSGNVFVQSNNLTVWNLSSTIAGSGDITYSHEGSCTSQKVVMIGSGDVSSASIVCISTFVNLVGSGDVLVQTTENLTVATFFLGDVFYYGTRPHNITASSQFEYGVTHKHAKEIVRRAKKNTYKEYEVNHVPQRKSVYVVVKTSEDTQRNDPIVHYDLELDSYDANMVQHFLWKQKEMDTSTAGETSWPLSAWSIGSMVLIVGIVVANRKRRHDYHRL